MSADNDQGNTGSASPNEANRDSQASGGLTEEQTKVVNEIVSKALGARFKAFETKQAASQKEFGESLTASLSTSLTETLAQQLEALRPAGNEGGKGKTPVEQDDTPRVKGLLKTVDELKKQNLEREQREQATAAQLKDKTLREKLNALLSQNGIDGKNAAHATGYLVDAAKKIAWGEDGESLTFKDDSGDTVDAATGIKSWVSSEDGKLYVPPSRANGSGERGAGRKPPVTAGNGAPPSTTEIGQGIASAFGISIT